MSKNESGAVTGRVKWWLRLEGLFIFLVCGIAMINYYFVDVSWYIMIPMFIFPDLSFLGYLVSKRVGAICYNVMHSYVTAIVGSYVVAFILGRSIIGDPAWYLVMFAVTWCAHISLDRFLGFGFKYEKGFEFTHFGKVKTFFNR